MPVQHLGGPAGSRKPFGRVPGGATGIRLLPSNDQCGPDRDPFFLPMAALQKRMHDDPTAGLTKLNEDEDPRHERRPLSDEEAQKLVEKTNASTAVFRGLTGQDRAIMYLLAQRTGLRRGELRSLPDDPSTSRATRPPSP